MTFFIILQCPIQEVSDSENPRSIQAGSAHNLSFRNYIIFTRNYIIISMSFNISFAGSPSVLSPYKKSPAFYF